VAPFAGETLGRSLAALLLGRFSFDGGERIVWCRKEQGFFSPGGRGETKDRWTTPLGKIRCALANSAGT